MQCVTKWCAANAKRHAVKLKKPAGILETMVRDGGEPLLLRGGAGSEASAIKSKKIVALRRQRCILASLAVKDTRV